MVARGARMRRKYRRAPFPAGGRSESLVPMKSTLATPPAGPTAAPALEIVSALGNPAQADGRALAADVVPRPALVKRLREEPGPLALVVAPPGYGKTTLLEEWDRHDDRPFAWVTAQEEHDDATAFVGAIERALHAASPAAAGGIGEVSRSPRRSLDTPLARLAASLEGRSTRPFVLVLDDLHLLSTATAGDVVGTLMRNLPRGSRIALASRSEPPIPVGRLRANRHLTEVASRDLKMNAAEAEALCGLSGVALSAANVDALLQKTEGWAAGLALATVALRGRRDLSAAVAGFGGDDPVVADYLREELLAPLPQDEVEFLARTSMLEQLSAPLCDAVLERRGCADVLASIAARNPPLISAQRSREVHRCHPLLRQMLRSELRRSAPEEEPRLHRRASDWYEQHHDRDRAVHHAVAAGDAKRAARLLRGHAAEYVSARRLGSLGAWLDRLEPEQIATHPSLTLAAANGDFVHGKLDGVQRWASAASRVMQETPPSRRTAAQEASVALLSAVLAARGTARMGEDAARAYDLEPEDSPWRALCCLLQGVALHLGGDRDAAERRLDEGIRRGAVAAPNVQALCLSQRAHIAMGRQDLEGASAFAARAVAQAEHHALDHHPSAAHVLAASAAVAAGRGRVADAQRDAVRAERLLNRLSDFVPWYEAEVRLGLASVDLRLGDVRGAREHIAAASRAARRMPGASVLDGWIDAVAASVESSGAPVVGEHLALTSAELRILTFLPTHLSFREIAGRLSVSANTVKTQAHSIYRKLEAGSRSEAVARAVDLGLLER